MLFASHYINENINLAPTFRNLLYDNTGMTIRIDIEPTEMLDTLMDRLRQEEGYRPFYKHRKNVDKNGWYNYFVECTQAKCVGMYGVPENSESADDGVEYELPLAEKQKSWMYDRVRSLIGMKQWEDAFARARKKMVEMNKVNRQG